MTAIKITGASPDRRPCPRCERKVGGFFAGGRFQQARHNDPKTGKPCREPKRAPGTGRIIGAAVALLLFLGAAPASPAARDERCFMPGGGCAARALAVVGAARHLRVLEYELTARPFVEAIVTAAHQPRADVVVVLDKTQAKVCTELAGRGVVAYLDGAHAIMHIKAIVANKLTVVDGSYNLSDSAEHRNAEVMKIRSSRAEAADYLQQFESHRAHAKLCAPPAP